MKDGSDLTLVELRDRMRAEEEAGLRPRKGVLKPVPELVERPEEDTTDVTRSPTGGDDIEAMKARNRARRDRAEHLRLQLAEGAGRRAIAAGEVEEVQLGPNGRLIKGDKRKALEAEADARRQQVIEAERAERAKEAAQIEAMQAARRKANPPTAGGHGIAD